jgi:hypothetical protein
MATVFYTATNKSELVARINSANAGNPNNTYYIRLSGSPSDFVLDQSFPPYGSYLGPAAFPIITRDIVIDGRDVNGNYANGFTIQRSSTTQYRFFAVNAKTSDNPNARLELRNLILRTGDSGAYGGGTILNDGRLVLYRCTIRGSRGGTYGGAIYNGDSASMKISSCLFINNKAIGAVSVGGAIYNSDAATFNIKNSTFKGNDAISAGGAIYLFKHLDTNTRVNTSAFVENTAGTGNDIYNNGPYVLNGRCNWWGPEQDGPSFNDAPIGVDTSNWKPALRPINLDEMVYPVFGEERSTFGNNDLTAAVVAKGFSATHRAIDLVPIKAFSNTACPASILPEWDDAYQHQNLSTSLKAIYALTDGELTAFSENIPGTSTPGCVENNVAFACNAQLRVTNPSSPYYNRIFIYSHVRLVPSMAINSSRSVKAGEPIGYIIRHTIDGNADFPSHLHFATRASSASQNDYPHRFVITGVLETNSEKAYGLCPDQNC